MYKPISLSEIPQPADLRGYLWFSDQSKPITQISEIALALKTTTDASNPFIIEAWLHSPSENKSWSVRFIDGKHITTEFDLSTKQTFDVKRFIAHRIPNVSQIIFRQYWKEETDPLCEGMPTLIPDAQVFVGFENSKTKGE